MVAKRRKQEFNFDSFDWKKPEVYVSFPQGRGARHLFQRLGDVPHNLNYNGQLIVGSSNIGATRIGSELRKAKSPWRVANPRDLSRPEVMTCVSGYYSDSSALALITQRDSYERNDSIIDELIPLVEEANGRLEFPLLVTGYDYQLNESNKDYGVKIVKRDDFRAVRKDFLDSKYHKWYFSKVDEDGMPIDLHREKRSEEDRQFWINPVGLSRLALNYGFVLGSFLVDLGGSNSGGRVVLVSDGEAVGA